MIAREPKSNHGGSSHDVSKRCEGSQRSLSNRNPSVNHLKRDMMPADDVDGVVDEMS